MKSKKTEIPAGGQGLKNKMLDSKLLIQENPITLPPSLAILTGLKKATFLQEIHFMARMKAYDPETYASDFYDGSFWVWETLEGLANRMPYLCKPGAKVRSRMRMIQRLIDELQTDGLLEVLKFDAYDGDQTNWYRVNHEEIDALERKHADLLLEFRTVRYPKKTRGLQGTIQTHKPEWLEKPDAEEDVTNDHTPATNDPDDGQNDASVDKMSSSYTTQSPTRSSPRSSIPLSVVEGEEKVLDQLFGGEDDKTGKDPFFAKSGDLSSEESDFRPLSSLMFIIEDKKNWPPKIQKPSQDQLQSWFEELWKLQPKDVRFVKGDAFKNFCKLSDEYGRQLLITPDLFNHIRAALTIFSTELWPHFEGEDRRWVPRLHNFFAKGHWRSELSEIQSYCEKRRLRAQREKASRRNSSESFQSAADDFNRLMDEIEANAATEFDQSSETEEFDA